MASEKILCGRKNQRGITLLVVMLAITFLSVILSGVMTYAHNSHKNSRRLALSSVVQQAAVSEIEFLHNRWAQAISETVQYGEVPQNLENAGLLITAEKSPALKPISTLGGVAGQNPYQVERTLTYIQREPFASTGAFRYEARVKVRYLHPSFGLLEAKAGRMFTMEKRPMFENAIFVQGTLELTAGCDMVVRGPIAVNGDAYAASQPTYLLRLAGLVKVTGSFNGSKDIGKKGTDLRASEAGPLPTGITLSNAVFDSTPDNNKYPRSQDEARAAQLRYLPASMNFIGGVDVDDMLGRYPDAYKDKNSIYRSVIAPPPLDDAGAPVDEDSVVSANRMYAKASLIIKIDEGGSLSITDPRAPKTNYAQNTSFSNVVTAVRQDAYDPREKSDIKVTTLSISNLQVALASSGLSNQFQGVVYIYDTQKNIGKAKAVIRLIDGQSTPNYNDMGFTVASDNALYVQGNYNTSFMPDTTLNNRAVIMGDTITAVSAGWTPERSKLPLAQRRATTERVPANAKTTAKNNTQSLVAGILAGGSFSANGQTGGGIQNLVRFVENWDGKNFKIKGSLGLLFQSTQFTGAFQDPTSTGGVYVQPDNRDIAFDGSLASNPPGQAIAITQLSRGEILN